MASPFFLPPTLLYLPVRSLSSLRHILVLCVAVCVTKLCAAHEAYRMLLESEPRDLEAEECSLAVQQLLRHQSKHDYHGRTLHLLYAAQLLACVASVFVVVLFSADWYQCSAKKLVLRSHCLTAFYIPH